jgi:hypothetical protein
MSTAKRISLFNILGNVTIGQRKILAVFAAYFFNISTSGVLFGTNSVMYVYDVNTLMHKKRL